MSIICVSSPTRELVWAVKTDETDKRSVRITLTGKEKGFADMVGSVSDEMNQVFYKGFRDEEILQFEAYLERILENCKDAEQKEGKEIQLPVGSISKPSR